MSIGTILLIQAGPKKDSSINLRHIAQLYTDRSNDYVYYACIHVFRIDHDDDDDDNDDRTIDFNKEKKQTHISNMCLYIQLNWKSK